MDEHKTHNVHETPTMTDNTPKSTPKNTENNQISENSQQNGQNFENSSKTDILPPKKKLGVVNSNGEKFVHLIGSVKVQGTVTEEGNIEPVEVGPKVPSKGKSGHNHHNHHNHHHGDGESCQNGENGDKNDPKCDKSDETCCHSDISDDENDTEPGITDPVNEYDTEIDYIDLTNDRLVDIGDISKCHLLTEIVLRQNKLTNDIFPKLNALPSLIRIDLYENRINPIPRANKGDGNGQNSSDSAVLAENPSNSGLLSENTPNPTNYSPNTGVLSNLVNLEELDLSFNQLRFTRGLYGLKSLTSLYLIENKITYIGDDINFISDKLRILELGSNRIRKIENLKNFAFLEELFLGRNKISKIDEDSFKNLPKLRVLSLQSNRIVNLEHFDGVSGTLEELYISHNGIKKLENLKKCKKLRVIDLAGNFLTDIDADQLADMHDLEELWLNDNKIANFDWLYKIKHLKKLKTLYLERNPCCGDTSIMNPNGRAAYVQKVREILPQLEQIDAEYFS
jgi:Leucine-rich repeat (LRR) protein